MSSTTQEILNTIMGVINNENNAMQQIDNILEQIKNTQGTVNDSQQKIIEDFLNILSRIDDLESNTIIEICKYLQTYDCSHKYNMLFQMVLGYLLTFNKLKDGDIEIGALNDVDYSLYENTSGQSEDIDIDFSEYIVRSEDQTRDIEPVIR
jgi:hypothetical protein